MTIPLTTNPGGLFTRIGKVLKVLKDLNSFQATTLPTDITNLLDQYALGEDEMVTGTLAQLSSAQDTTGLMQWLQTVAAQTVTTMVEADVPQFDSTDLSTALSVLISQMTTASQSVLAMTVGATVTAGSNQGNGVCVATTYRADGSQQENLLAETVSLAVAADSTTGATAGQELFTATGTEAETDTLAWDWPRGSASSTSINAVDASTTGGTNLTLNGDFEMFTTPNVPDDWTILVGTAGTTVKESTSTFYTGTASLNFVGNGSELTSVAQDITSSVVGLTLYTFNLWFKLGSSAPGAGVLEVSLVNGSNTVVDDAQGNGNVFTTNLNSVADTNWHAFSGTFRTPYLLPTTVQLRVRLSTALSNTVNLYLDRVGLTAPSQLYVGGPSLAIFSGSTDFFWPDTFSVGLTNSRGSAGTLATFQTGFERLFSMSSMGLLLPSSGSATINDSLIS